MLKICQKLPVHIHDQGLAEARPPMIAEVLFHTSFFRCHNGTMCLKQVASHRIPNVIGIYHPTTRLGIHCMIQMALAVLFVWGRILKVTFARYFPVNVRERGGQKSSRFQRLCRYCHFHSEKKSVTDLSGSHEVQQILPRFTAEAA